MDAKIAAKTISEDDYGLHCLLIYSDLTVLREFYTHYIPEQIKDKEEVIKTQIEMLSKDKWSFMQSPPKEVRDLCWCGFIFGCRRWCCL